MSAVRFSTESGILPLMLLLKEKLGEEWPTWEPETTEHEINLVFGIDLAQDLALRDRVHSLSTFLRRPDVVFSDYVAFEKTGIAFSGRIAQFNSSQPLSPGQCGLVIKAYYAISDNDKLDLGDEVEGYIAATLHSRGFIYAPPDLFADTMQALKKMWAADVSEHSREVETKWSEIITSKNIVEKIQKLEADAIVDAQIKKLFVAHAYATLLLHRAAT